MSLHGAYRFKKYKPLPDGVEASIQDREVIWEGPWIKNLIVSSTTTGTGLITRRLAGDTTYDIVVTTGSIGTGTATPTDADTGLATSVLAGILPSFQTYDATSATIQFFMAAADLANGTYSEFALWCGAKLLARSIISPGYTKATGEDTGVEYVITLSNT